MTTPRDEQRQKEKRLRNEWITKCQRRLARVGSVWKNVELLNCNHSALDLSSSQGKHLGGEFNRNPSENIGGLSVRKFISFTLAGVLTLLAQAGARAQSFVDYTGGSYNQNFDSLPFSNNVSVSEANPVTISAQTYFFNNASLDFAAAIDGTGPTNASTGGLGLSATMSGWYGSGTVTTRVGAQPGDQT